MAAPVGDEALRHDPEESVMPAHAGTPLSAQRHGELLPQEQVLQHQRTAAAERGTQKATEEREQIEHRVMIANHNANHLSSPADGVFAPYSPLRGRRRAIP